MDQQRTFKERRLEANLSQEDLAKKLSVSPITVGAWERGRYTPSAENLLNLSKIFQVDSQTILRECRAEQLEYEDKEVTKSSISFKPEGQNIF